MVRLEPSGDLWVTGCLSCICVCVCVCVCVRACVRSGTHWKHKASSLAPVPGGSTRDLQKCENLLYACQMSSLQKVIQLCIKLFPVVYTVRSCKEYRVAFKRKWSQVYTVYMVTTKYGLAVLIKMHIVTPDLRLTCLFFPCVVFLCGCWHSYQEIQAVYGKYETCALRTVWRHMLLI